MATLIVNRGLLRIGQQASESTNYNAARNIQTMSIDIGATAFAAAHTKLNDSADVTESASSYFDQAFTATPTESGQTIIHSTVIGTGNGNFVIRRIAMHDDTAANVTASSATLVMGVDGQTLTKTADFTVTITVRLTYTNTGGSDTLVVNRGLLRVGQQASESTNYSDVRNIQVMSIDDSTVSFAASDTALNSGGAVTNEFDAAFSATPTESGTATITHTMNVPTGSGNFTTRRIALHDDVAGTVSTSSTTLVAGVDDKSLGKTSDLSMDISMTLIYTSV